MQVKHFGPAVRLASDLLSGKLSAVSANVLEDHMPHLPRILVATPHEDTFDSLRALFAGDVELMAVDDPAQALRLIGRTEFDGVVADSRLGSRMGRIVLDSYLKVSPRGRAVLLASLEDPDTLMRLDIRSPRLEVIFRPWNEWELRTCLLGAPYEATGTAG